MSSRFIFGTRVSNGRTLFCGQFSRDRFNKNDYIEDPFCLSFVGSFLRAGRNLQQLAELKVQVGKLAVCDPRQRIVCISVSSAQIERKPI
jgi:hypothetical protein